MEGGLRQRIPHQREEKPQFQLDDSIREPVVLGKTPAGQGVHAHYGLLSAHSLTRVCTAIFLVFRVPTTHDVITALFHPSYPKSHIDMLNLGLLAFQLFLFYTLPSTPRKLFFFLYFGFWRAAYDAGLGYVLTEQSKRRRIVRAVHKLGWLDQERRPLVRAWIRKQLVGKMGKDYSFDVRSLIPMACHVASIDRAFTRTSTRV